MRSNGKVPPGTVSNAVLVAASVAAAIAGCALERDRGAGGDGVHPPGWAEEGSAVFHGTWLRDHGYPLGDCRFCHGDDYAGGTIGSSCESSGCHQEDVEACGTCHGQGEDPRPPSGAHYAHASMCAECHQVPADSRSPQHPDGVALVRLVDVGADAQWDTAERRCTDTVCHGASSPPWAEPTGIGCAGCHGEPPATHARWERVAGPGECEACHPPADGPEHLDGDVDLLPMECDACHGAGPLGAPPVSLAGESAADAPGVGAHRRHLDETLVGRIGRIAECDDCHEVPASVFAQGHLDTSPPSDVQLGQGESYQPASSSCVVGCHWYKTPGPVWTDDSGEARACDACHGMPPPETLAGTVHPVTEPTPAACNLCHSFDPLTHVDGHVDFNP
jgi:predicted CxxxxCH...CXXCH cytochrome family protein